MLEARLRQRSAKSFEFVEVRHRSTIRESLCKKNIERFAREAARMNFAAVVLVLLHPLQHRDERLAFDRQSALRRDLHRLGHAIQQEARLLTLVLEVAVFLALRDLE